MKTALLASYAKDEPLLRFARLLASSGYTLLGSAGTTKFLNENSISCTDVATIVGPPILGHRVVTLAREIYAGLLAATEEDFKELEQMGIKPIDLVYVTLYPLEEAIADPKATPKNVIEKTDIGGPTLLRAAAKGRRVTVSDPRQIDAVVELLSGDLSEKEQEHILTQLAAAAERRVASYVAASAAYLEARLK